LRDEEADSGGHHPAGTPSTRHLYGAAARAPHGAPAGGAGNREQPPATFCEKVLETDKFALLPRIPLGRLQHRRILLNPLKRRTGADMVTNYVLMDYARHRVMAVPAHDQRDFEFARRYGIPMRIVIQNADAA
jgi:leucyl-tRNA synthetase